MEKEIIEKYIQFAIDNWFKDLDWYKFLWLKYEIDHILWEFETNNWNYTTQLLWDNIIEIIMSKEFIEAVARWLKDNWIQKEELSVIIDWLTITQAIAIREWKLEEFINNLLK